MSAPLTGSRPDFATIAQWVAEGARVLDLGCGDGTLLRFLRDTRNATGYGVDISDENVLASVGNGVNVIQSDLEAGLSGFESGSFDYVILSQTLQAMKHTERLLNEILRVGREGIVTFPNFGYWRVRAQLVAGRMPVSRELPYQWYDTPNIHLFTIRDFETFCRGHALRILDRVVLTDGQPVSVAPNLFGSLAFYRLDHAPGANPIQP
ncbi:MAG: methionine biosynthesis protein MetW [Betaproteobacteria bacterium]|nr:methionine biosynthesis protein MetW [Betaproteobacteria bacterium]